MDLNSHWIGEIFRLQDTNSKDTIAIVGLNYREGVYVAKRYKNGSIGGVEADNVQYEPEQLKALIDVENHVYSSEIGKLIGHTYTQRGENSYDTIFVEYADFHRNILSCKHTHDGLCGGDSSFYKEIPFAQINELIKR